MTIRALVGIACLNLSYAFVGLSLLWGLRALRTWGEAALLAGLGYLVGLSAFGVLWTGLLVLGVPFGGASLVLVLVALAVTGVAVGVVRGVPLPTGRPRLGGTPMVLVSAVGVALSGLFLEAVFRAGRLQSLQEYDAWAFWVPKGKAIFFFDGLDEQVFTTTAAPFYPPLQPILDAAAFHAMGGVDVVTLHIQFWFVLVGFVWAGAGLLHRHVAAWSLWPPLVLLLVVPRYGERLLAPQADVLVDVFVVTAALSLALWLRDRAGWRVAASAILLAGAVNTKREGILFAGGVLLAAFVASRPRRWPALVAAAVAVGLAMVPWRIWTARHDLPAGAPSSFGSDRLWAALDVSFDVLYSTALWSVLPLVATIALGAAAVWGDRRLTAFVGVLALVLFAGGVWSTAGFEEFSLSADESGNPIVRLTGSIVLLAAVATPLLLSSVWRRGAEP